MAEPNIKFLAVFSLYLGDQFMVGPKRKCKTPPKYHSSLSAKKKKSFLSFLLTKRLQKLFFLHYFLSLLFLSSTKINVNLICWAWNLYFFPVIQNFQRITFEREKERDAKKFTLNWQHTPNWQHVLLSFLSSNVSLIPHFLMACLGV